MKRGEPPPSKARELVLKMAGIYPRPTNRQIREAVQRRFGEEIVLSDRTIFRYCRAARLPASTRDSEGPQLDHTDERGEYEPLLKGSCVNDIMITCVSWLQP